jgi:hypothetical protein
MIRDQIIEALRGHIEAGSIPNNALDVLKNHANSRFETDSNEISRLILRDYDLRGLYFAMPYNLFNLKGFKRKIEAGMIPTTPEVDEFIAKWEPVRELVEEAKKIVVKGRVLKEDPIWDRRTEENTGTCPVCFRNIKRTDEGGMVIHGYTKGDGYFRGQCIGVDTLPYELSPSGCEKAILRLQSDMIKIRELIQKTEDGGLVPILLATQRIQWVLNDDPRYPKMQVARLGELNRRLGQAESDLKFYRQKVEEWKLDTLPGIKAGWKR